MRIFDFQDYRAFIRAHLDSLPKKGRGETGHIARALRVHPTALSQVLHGSRDFSLEQAVLLCEHLGLTALESDYLLGLVNLARAGSEKLRQVHKRQLASLREQAQQLVSRVRRERVLKNEESSIFYSQWYYSAISLLSSIEGCQTRADIERRLRLPRAVVEHAIDFLVKSGLCVEEKGKLSMGVKSTHLGANSPLIARHHINWRVKALERLDSIDQNRELAFTAPLTLSKKDVPKVREELMKTAATISEMVLASGSELLFGLNMDWFEVS